MRSHNEGSLFRRNRDGRWVATVTMPDGRRRSASATTKGEGGALLRRLLDQRDRAVADPTRLRVGAYLRGWADGLTGLAPSTMRKHRSIVDVHLIPAFGRRLLVALSPSDVDAYLEGLRLDPQTKRHHRATLRLALAAAVRDGLLTRNAAALSKAPRMQKAERTYLTLPQVRRIIDDARDEPFWPLWVLILTTGLRVSEALGLAWSDVGDGRITVNGQLVRIDGAWARADPKTRRSRRSIQLTPPALEALAEQRRRQDDDRGEAPRPIDGLVFTMPNGLRDTSHGDGRFSQSRLLALLWDLRGAPWLLGDLGGAPVYAENLRKPRERMLRSLGLPLVTTHDMRHSAATMMLSVGVPLPVIADILGHSSIRVTADLYAHIGTELRQDAADRIAEALR